MGIYYDASGNAYDSTTGALITDNSAPADTSTADIINRAVSGDSTATTDVINRAIAGDTSAMSMLDQIVAAAPKIAAALSAFQVQQINMQRAKNGQAPLSTAYNPGFNIGLSNTTLLVLAGLAAVLLLRRESCP